MADLFSVTAPLAIRFPDGSRQVMIERLPYADGLLFLAPFWTDIGVAEALRFVPGPIRGEGPWKVGGAVVTVLACHGTDAELANEYSCWQSQLLRMAAAYRQREGIQRLLKIHAGGVANLNRCNLRCNGKD